MNGDETGGAPSAPALQFETVERTTPAARTCPACNRTIDDTYFEIAGKVICPSCAGAVGKGGHGSLARAALLGAAAALLGTIVWYAIVKLTGHELGLVAIGVGLVVGIAVRRGGRGLGGWRFQALAMALTYVSITASYVPFVVEGVRKAHQDKSADTSVAAPSDSSGSAAPAPGGANAAPKANLGMFLLAWLFVLGIAMAAPFFGGNIMGIIIIGIALYEAWKINRRIPLSGPFRLSGAAPSFVAASGGVTPPAPQS